MISKTLGLNTLPKRLMNSASIKKSGKLPEVIKRHAMQNYDHNGHVVFYH